MRSTTLAFSAVACLAALAAPADAAAKAAYRSLAETVRTAEIIAIVEVESVTPAELHGRYWEYAQQVTARPIEVLVGEVSGRLEIGAARDFICAPVRYDAEATYLVFLAHDGTVLATENNEWGRLWINGDDVEWPYEQGGATVPTATALREIRALLGTRDPGPPPSPELRVLTPEVPAAEVPAAEVPAAEVPAAEVPAAEVPANREPMECGYAASHRDGQARRFGGPPLWIATGALAVGLGFVVASRSRKR